MTPRKIWVARSQTAIACSQPSLIHSPAALYYPTDGRFVSSSSSRLAYIDWMPGLACVLMFQTHCYDSWLGGGARKSTFFVWSQLGGTLPAPLFLFLAGISFALVVDKLRQKDLAASQIARTTIRRGAEIFGLGLLFRLQEYLIAWGWAPWSDLFRVDILNTIGISMILMGVLCGLTLTVCRRARDSYKGPSGDSYQVMPSGIPQAQKGSGSSRCGPTL